MRTWLKEQKAKADTKATTVIAEATPQAEGLPTMEAVAESEEPIQDSKQSIEPLLELPSHSMSAADAAADEPQPSIEVRTYPSTV